MATPPKSKAVRHIGAQVVLDPDTSGFQSFIRFSPRFTFGGVDNANLRDHELVGANTE